MLVSKAICYDISSMNSNDSHTPRTRFQWMGVICALLTFGVVATLHTFATKGTTTLEALVISVASLLLFFPLLRISQPQSEAGKYQQAYRKTLIGLLSIAAVVSCIQYLIVSRVMVGGVDWYYYLCYSRDMVNSNSFSENAYSYFPGVYVFWTSVMRLVGQDLPTLQSFCQLALIVVCLLTGWIVRQHTYCKVLTLFSIFWTFVLFTKFDGLTGVTESLAVAPWLVGLLLWRGQPLDDQQPLWRIVLFGVAMGVTVFTKQQAGLLSLGFAYLLAEQLQKNDKPHAWKHLLIVPVTAGITLVLLVVCLGNGLTPLTMGVKTAGQYGTEQSWLLNLYTQVRHDESLWITMSIAGVLFLGRSRWLSTNAVKNQPSWRLIGFSLVAILATLLQFRARPFHHYMLLSIPATVIVCSITYDRYRSWVQASRRKRILVGAILILPCIWFAPYNDSYHPLRLQMPNTTQWERQHTALHDPNMQAIITTLEKHIPAESRLLIMPGRYNHIHFALQSLADNETGYNFRTRQFASEDQSWQAPLHQTSAEFVLLLTGSTISEAEQKHWRQRQSKAKHLLKARNYIPVAECLSPEQGILFRKNGF